MWNRLLFIFCVFSVCANLLNAGTEPVNYRNITMALLNLHCETPEKAEEAMPAFFKRNSLTMRYEVDNYLLAQGWYKVSFLSDAMFNKIVENVSLEVLDFRLQMRPGRKDTFFSFPFDSDEAVLQDKTRAQKVRIQAWKQRFRFATRAHDFLWNDYLRSANAYKLPVVYRIQNWITFKKERAYLNNLHILNTLEGYAHFYKIQMNEDDKLALTKARAGEEIFGLYGSHTIWSESYRKPVRDLTLAFEAKRRDPEEEREVLVSIKKLSPNAIEQRPHLDESGTLWLSETSPQAGKRYISEKALIQLLGNGFWVQFADFAPGREFFYSSSEVENALKLSGTTLIIRPTEDNPMNHVYVIEGGENVSLSNFKEKARCRQPLTRLATG